MAINTPKPLTRSEMFDARRNELLEQIAEGGGGGGSGGGLVVAHATVEQREDGYVVTAFDKDYSELLEAPFSVVVVNGSSDAPERLKILPICEKVDEDVGEVPTTAFLGYSLTLSGSRAEFMIDSTGYTAYAEGTE